MGYAAGPREAAAFFTTIGLATGAVGCGSAHVDKAGGSAPAKPLVLTLAAHDDDEAYGTFAASVTRLSHGSIRIRIVGDWGVTGDRRELDFERGIVNAVRAGKVQLGIVGVRIWDTLGIDRFQALVAPFLIDSLQLEQRALGSPSATRALAAVARRGVVGIALLPGRLRRPLGTTRPLVRAADYLGAKIATRAGAVARATFRALGARPASYIPGDLLGFDGTENDALTITQNDYDAGARTFATNVVLWPKPQTLVMNRAALDRLTTQQRRILRAAGHDAAAPELARIARDQRLGLLALCAARTVTLVSASQADLAALRKAVQPVYDQLERDPLTRLWIAQILHLKATGAFPANVARC
jgi:TRAP-type C4-dicarboxylate transport system substrate-binding protein